MDEQGNDISLPYTVVLALAFTGLGILLIFNVFMCDTEMKVLSLRDLGYSFNGNHWILTWYMVGAEYVMVEVIIFFGICSNHF